MDNATRTPRRKPASRPPAIQPANDAAAFVSLGGLSHHLGYALKRAQLRVFDDFMAAVAPLKLSPAQFSVLLLIETNPGRNQTEIAATLGILRPNFVALLDGLEARGFCMRKRSPEDRRSHVLTLTERGRATLQEAKRLVAARHDRKLAALLSADERAQLQDLLERVAQAL